jgi:hypothetical protein
MMDAQYIKSILHYDPLTGIFVWIKTLSVSGQSGNVAGSIKNTGHREIQIGKRKYKAHRLAWLYMTGSWPELELDHINGNPSDNRMVNLREVSHRVNGQNRPEHRAGKLLGATYNKKAKKWYSQIMTDGKIRHIGSFDTEIEASKAYLKEARN